MLGVFVRRQWFVAGEVCDVGAERDPGCAVVHAFFGRGAFDPGRDLCDELAGHDAGVFVVYHREPWPVLAGATVVLLIFGGVSFISARLGRYGAVAAAMALLLGAWVHFAWSLMMQARLEMLPAGLAEADRVMLEDTILFAANAQIPHILKNFVLIGVCAVVFVLAPRLCGSRERKAK
ncbi:MAG: hypothetical protein COB69_00425 [Phycisphaera sp.]|nr:MAG: hypothetical protein COB69_00425 [Phycisphaera sp.]